jgi:HEAT repeat protein
MILTLLLFGLASVQEDINNASNTQLPESERMEIFERLAAGAGSHQEALESIAKDSEQNPTNRWIAIRAIGKGRLLSARPALESLCSDKDATIRVAALTALAEMQAVQSTELIAQALQDPAMIVRGAAADALGVLKDVRSVDDLESALQSRENFYRGQSVWVRVRFVLALGAIGDKLAMPALERSLTDSDTKVVDATLIALKDIVGYDFSEGRSREEHIQAWQRWIPANR